MALASYCSPTVRGGVLISLSISRRTAPAMHFTPLHKGRGEPPKVARGRGFNMKKYIKPMIAVCYVDTQGICAGSQVQFGPGYATEDACSKGNTTQLSIRDVWEDK